MNHRKKIHAENIGTCRYELRGSCWFSANECWFMHDNSSSEYTKNTEILKRLFDLMEKFAERMTILENKE